MREDLVSQLQGRNAIAPNDPALMQRISEIRAGLLAGDEEQGNGGGEVLQTLVNFYHHPPAEDFVSTRAYLDYRWEDIANRCVSIVTLDHHGDSLIFCSPADADGSASQASLGPARSSHSDLR